MPNEQRPCVLVVEDEADIATLIKYNLDSAGFDVTTAMDGEEALLVTREHHFDLILLDWMLPLVSGIEICRQLRQRPDTKGVPIIMLTARGEENARIQGLNAGADDYVTKPFSPKELIARIHAVLRRANPALSEDVLTYLDITMDTGTQRVTRNGTAIDLRPAEFKLLHHFMGQPGRVFSREQLLDAVW
ncbi:MAG: response regulator, partial [Alphaproteobacteria bacterium]